MKFKVTIHRPSYNRFLTRSLIEDNDDWMLTEYAAYQSPKLFCNPDLKNKPSLGKVLKLIKPKDVIYK